MTGMRVIAQRTIILEQVRAAGIHPDRPDVIGLDVKTVHGWERVWNIRENNDGSFWVATYNAPYENVPIQRLRAVSGHRPLRTSNGIVGCTGDLVDNLLGWRNCRSGCVGIKPETVPMAAKNGEAS